MTRATVDGVSFHGIRGGSGSRGRVRARRIVRPRSSSAWGEAELAPEVLADVLSCYVSHQGLSGGVRMHNDVGESLTRLWSS
jgi:hypothetical protein